MAKSAAIAATVIVSAALSGCEFGSERYDAEVGYYEGGQTRWDLWGDFKTLEACRSAAIGRYNAYFAQKRAYTWSCLKKNGSGGYSTRHR